LGAVLHLGLGIGWRWSGLGNRDRGGLGGTHWRDWLQERARPRMSYVWWDSGRRVVGGQRWLWFWGVLGWRRVARCGSVAFWASLVAAGSQRRWWGPGCWLARGFCGGFAAGAPAPSRFAGAAGRGRWEWCRALAPGCDGFCCFPGTGAPDGPFSSPSLAPAACSAGGSSGPALGVAESLPSPGRGCLGARSRLRPAPVAVLVFVGPAGPLWPAG